MIRFLLAALVLGLIYWIFRKQFRSTAPMSPAEAARVLSVSEEATADEVLAAHKKLIAKVHPDKGGSAELAAQVNQARDILLGRLTKS